MKKLEDFKVGDRVCCITGDLHIECKITKIIEDNPYGFRNIQVLDPVTGRTIMLSLDEIDHDKAYYRAKALEALGI